VPPTLIQGSKPPESCKSHSRKGIESPRLGHTKNARSNMYEEAGSKMVGVSGKRGEGGEGGEVCINAPTHVAMARSCSSLLPLQASLQAVQYCLRLSALSSLLVMVITAPAPSADEELEDEEEDRALI
jgi:hypothetical protein